MNQRILNIIRNLVEDKSLSSKVKVAKPKEEDPSHKIIHVKGEPHLMVKGKRGYTFQKLDRKAHSKYLPLDTDLSKLFGIDIVDK
jgi:hypothetical protein